MVHRNNTQTMVWNKKRLSNQACHQINYRPMPRHSNLGSKRYAFVLQRGRSMELLGTSHDARHLSRWFIVTLKAPKNKTTFFKGQFMPSKNKRTFFKCVCPGLTEITDKTGVSGFTAHFRREESVIWPRERCPY